MQAPSAQRNASSFARSLTEVTSTERRSEVLEQYLQWNNLDPNVTSQAEASRIWKEIKSAGLFALLLDVGGSATVQENDTWSITASDLLFIHIITMVLRRPLRDHFEVDAEAMNLLAEKAPPLLETRFPRHEMFLSADPLTQQRVFLPTISLMGAVFSDATVRGRIHWAKRFDRERLLRFAYHQYFDPNCWVLRPWGQYELPPPHTYSLSPIRYYQTTAKDLYTPFHEQERMECFEFALFLLVHSNLTNPRPYANQAASEAVKKYGADAIAKRLLYFLRTEAYLKRRTVVNASIHLALHLQDAEDFEVTFWNERFPEAFVDSYWKPMALSNASSKTREDFAAETLVNLSSAAKHFQNRKLAGKVRSWGAADLPHFRDTLLLLGRTLQHKNFIDTMEDAAETIVDYISTFQAQCGDSPNVQQGLFNAWKHVCESLKETHRLFKPETKVPYQEVAKRWKSFARIILPWIPVAQLDTIFEDSQSIQTSGCAWYKCPLYRNDVLGQKRPMRVCGSCKNAIYCGNKCQRLDWKEGGHRQKCRNK